MARAAVPAEKPEQAARAVLAGERSVQDIALSLGVSARTVYRWVAKARPEALHDQRQRTLIHACQAALDGGTYPTVTLGDVGARAGMSDRMALHYFPTKQALFEAAIDDLVRKFWKEVLRLRAGGDPGADPVDQLGHLFVAIVAAVEAVPHGRVLFRDLDLPDADDRRLGWRAALINVTEPLVASARDAGDFPCDVDTRSAAGILVSVLRGLILGLGRTPLPSEKAAHVARGLPGLLT